MSEYLWCIDATAISGFKSYDEAKAALDESPEKIKVSATGEVIFVRKADIVIMSSEEFDSL